MTVEKTVSWLKSDHVNGAACFNATLDSFVSKLRASHEAEIEVLRTEIQHLTCKASAWCPATPPMARQLSSKASVTKACFGEAHIVASGGDSFRSSQNDEELQAMAMDSPGEDGYGESEGHGKKLATFVTRTVWNFQRASTAEKSLDQLVFRRNEGDGEGTRSSNNRLSKGFSFRGIPAMDKAQAMENMNRYISSPTAKWRVCWNIVGLLAVIFDLVLIPLILMELPDIQALIIIGYILHIYWNFDILANFFVAYYDTEGDLIINPGQIARHYASTWLPLDTGLVALDWLLYLMDWIGGAGGADGLQAGRTLRIIRFLRILRLMRLLKLGAILAPLVDRFSYGVTVMYFLILKIIFGVFSVNHFMACFWFAVGAGDDEGWVATSKIRDYSFSRRYLLAYHWCLTQFGVGSSPIYPSSESEFGFAVFCLVIALLLFSFTVSLTTDAMLRLQKMHHERSEQFSTYRKYCKDRRVSKDLFGRTLRFLEYAYDQREKQTPASEIELLQILSGPLRNELQLEIWVPDISCHQFFRLLCRSERSTMQSVCRDALVETHYAQEDNVFNTGQIAKHMYFVVEGTLVYVNNGLEMDEKVGKRACVSEAAMWTEWLHLGKLSVEIECRILALEVAKFCDCVKGHSGAFSKVSDYAKRYVQLLNKVTYENLSDVDSEETIAELMRESAEELDAYKSKSAFNMDGHNPLDD